METCEYIEGCQFFAQGLDRLPAMLVEGYRARYCRDGCSRCARYVIATRLGRVQVPVDLGPHEAIRALTVLHQHGVVLPPNYFDIAERTIAQAKSV